MPRRNSFIHSVESTTPRRSPRFLLRGSTTEPLLQPRTPRKAEDIKSLDSKSTRKWVCCSKPSSPTHIQIVPLPQSHKGSKNKSSKKSNDYGIKSRNGNTFPAELRRSSRLNNDAGGFPCLRRSSRLSRPKIVFRELRDSPRRGMKKSRKPDHSLGDSENVTRGPRKPAELNSRVQSLRRSQRLLNEKHVTSRPDRPINSAKSLEVIDIDSDFSVEEESDQVVAHKAEAHVTSRPDQAINRAKSLEIIDIDSDFSVEEDSDNKAEAGDKSFEKSSGKGEQMTRDVSVTREEFTIEGREVRVRYEDKNEALVKGKRKRDEDSEATAKGWTKEQEVALQKAYFAAKPTPHFWKKVSKLVPGKSAQDCFERIHQDHLTPPQHQPRSRAKKMMSSPLQEVVLSASKLLKPIVNKAKRSSCSKSKSYLTQKSLRKLLQRNSKVDRDHEGDLFSVLEPNADVSTNAFPPIDALSTPEKLDEKQGWRQSCNDKSSSRHGKPFSRLSSSCDSDIVSPPVLKQVKNRVLHEKYINQLRCREARRRAASARVEMPKLGKIVTEESIVQKSGVVESAKIALMSEARDAIKKFQHLQANLMDTCSTDEDIDDHVEAETFGEDESQ
ncbi:uncharacterized protein LOC129323130 [Prosopis cineraria]|uniref:uncharacterized protein LOC129323130 n=1 Tax=Prosopis cineraria TaxID=364024 RepID=UPI002410649B|nr:uncharacterized protein LOC129323130 [Prosopis cineraria]